MKFLVDAQLPPALARWFRDAGYEAQHVEEAGLRTATDTAIWAYALKTGVIVVTKDEDFAVRSTRDSHAPVIVWLRVGNATNPALRAWFEPRWPGIVQLLGQGNRLVEVV